MSPEERDRLTTLEVELANVKQDLAEIKGNTAALLTAFNMGRGGAVAAAKLGGLILLLFGALSWLVDHIPHWLGAK